MHNLPSLLKGASGGINSLFTLKYSLLRYYRDNLKLYVQPPKSDLLRSSFSNRTSILRNNLSAFLKSKPNLTKNKPNIHLVLLSWDYLQALFFKVRFRNSFLLKQRDGISKYRGYPGNEFFFTDIGTRHVESVKTNKLGHLISLPRDNSLHPTG